MSPAGTPDATTIGRFRARLETEGRLAALFAGGDGAARGEERDHGRGTGGDHRRDGGGGGADRAGEARARARPTTRDPEAGAHVKINARGRKVGTWGYQFQVNVDEDGFIHAQAVTPGNPGLHRLEHLEGGRFLKAYGLRPS